MTLEKLFAMSTPKGDCIICPLSPAHIYPRIKGKSSAGRFVWESMIGPIPEGMFVLHKCDTPRCIRLDHLFLGTKADNMRDKVTKGRQHFGGPGKRIPLELYPFIIEHRYAGATYDTISQELREFGIYACNRTIRRFLNDRPHD